MITKVEIAKYDGSNMFNVLAKFPDQLEEAFEIGTAVNAPDDAKGLSNIIITGLGGSAVGGDLLRSYLQYEIKVPVLVNRNYHLPGFADKDTLVICSSYSGSTEETLSAYAEAKEKGCKIICISSGGELSQNAATDGNYVITVPKGYQPRCALAFSFVPLLMLIAKLGYISERSDEIKGMINRIREKSLQYTNIDDNENSSVNLANHIAGKIPVIYSSTDIMDVVNYRWRCQLEENSEVLAFGHVVPEMNHNEIVGWQKNQEILRKFVVIYLADKDDNPRIKTRMEIMRGIIKPCVDTELFIEAEGSTKLERLFDLIYLGDWISFYLAIINKANPSTIENINILKNKLAEN